MNYSRIHKLCTQLYLDLNRLKNRFVCKKELKSLLTTSLRLYIRRRSSPHLFSLVLSASKKEIQILQLLAHGQCRFLFAFQYNIILETCLKITKKYIMEIDTLIKIRISTITERISLSIVMEVVQSDPGKPGSERKKHKYDCYFCLFSTSKSLM